jgi:hypothetical protein
MAKNPDREVAPQSPLDGPEYDGHFKHDHNHVHHHHHHMMHNAERQHELEREHGERSMPEHGAPEYQSYHQDRVPIKRRPVG